jgi:hypothetical protein
VGEAGQVTLTGGGTALTLLEDTSLCRIGYITPGTGSLACVGTSALTAIGYLIPGVPIWHGAVLIEAGHYESVTTTHYVTFVWENNNWRKYIDGNPTNTWYGQDRPDDYTYETQGQIWHKPWDTHDPVWVEDSWQAAYDEELADIWVPLNATASLTALFVSIKTTPSVDEGDAPIFFG